jgi:hypothetical protein
LVRTVAPLGGAGDEPISAISDTTITTATSTAATNFARAEPKRSLIS